MPNIRDAVQKVGDRPFTMVHRPEVPAQTVG
jgi:hypothetical protein